MGTSEQDIKAIEKQVEMGMRLKYLEQENEELKQRTEEMYQMIVSMNQTIIQLDNTIKSVAEPLNNDIIELKNFAKDFNKTKYKVLGGIVVIATIASLVWGVVSSVMSKQLDKFIG